MEYTVSIDRLTILGDKVEERFQTTLDNNNFGFIERDGMAQHPYKRNFYMVDGSILQWTDIPSHKALRYEFNPNRVRYSRNSDNLRRQAVFEILRTMKYPSFSRIDIAVDIFGVDLSAYAVIYNEPVKRNCWQGSTGRLETLYLGAPSSEYRIRIYDKNLEQGVEEPEGDWWRVELQLRGGSCETVLQFWNMIPVFKGLKFVKPDYESIEDFKVRSVIYYLLNHPDGFSRINKNTRSKYRKILNSMRAFEEIKIDDLFESKKSNILEELQEWLMIGQRNDFM